MKAEEIDARLAEIKPSEFAAPKPRSSVMPAMYAVPLPLQKPTPEQERKLAALREQRLQKRAERQVAAEAELSARLSDKRADHQRIKTAVTSTETLCALLMGPTGCGKSTGARYLTRHASPYWLRAIDLSTAERRHGLGEGLPPEVERARNATALVIDDVGHEKDIAALFDVLDWRNERNLPTIVTTGLTRAELTQHLSAATVRRITEQHCGQMRVLVVDCHGVKP
ncbi:MAG TPA: hypothetical protein VHO25_16625 [Polyangiaceae bacterium]|nr:hypothetical protein [Polyangiaceae bacterium]